MDAKVSEQNRTCAHVNILLKKKLLVTKGKSVPLLWKNLIDAPVAE